MVFDDLLSELNSPEFQALRPMQHNVFEQCGLLLNGKGAVTKGDVAIEMPAGTGKTLLPGDACSMATALEFQIPAVGGAR